MWNETQEQIDALAARLRIIRAPEVHREPDKAVTAAIRAEAVSMYGDGPAAERAAYEMECFAHERGLLQRCPPLWARD